MFKYISNQKGLLVVLMTVSLCLAFLSCNEEKFLETEPIDFYSPSNSYVTAADYDAAVLRMYKLVRDEFFSSDSQNDFPSAGMQATDLFHLHKNIGFNTSLSSILLPTSDNMVYQPLWRPAYQIIYDANAVIERANSDDNELTAEEKAIFTAEAKFFRGYFYKMLANLFGGVPIVVEETKAPLRDFTRAARDAVYEQAAADLRDAAAGLGEIDQVADHRLNSLAAYHVLSEVYISLGQWQDAIDAASMVINHTNTDLMTERFGTRKDDKALIPQYDTNVYWDLFRQGNQNRSIGNTEAIWVLQFAWQVVGGGDTRDGGGGPELERTFAPRAWQAKIENDNGKTSPLVPNPNAYTGGRSSGFIRPTYYFFETLWQKSGYDQDIRNADCNIVRDFIVRNPDSDHNGKWIFADNLPIRMKSLNDTTRNMYPWIMKASTPGKQPPEAFLTNPVVEGGLSFSHVAFRDVYAIRLAETYLLRAEAHLGNGNAQLAADDINVVRGRAQAPLITAGDVDIDYILDERARELHLEEFRLLTLTRLNKLVEVTRRNNPHDGNTYADHNNLWPIPFSEIEKNIEAELTQNTGY